MSNSVIKRELTALLQDKEYFEFLRHQRILVTGATGLIGSLPARAASSSRRMR